MPPHPGRVTIDGMPEAAAAPLVEPRPPRKLYRSGDGRWLGGVARGLAGHLGLPVIWVRLVFVGLFMADGLGALLYAAFVHATGFAGPTDHLWGGVMFGAATSLLPWLLLLPAFGWGWFGRRGPRGSNALLASTVSHIPYGLGVGVVMALGSSL